MSWEVSYLMCSNDQKELVSILMPTYNVEKFVEEAVQSMLLQTYVNFELIIVDDCSTDSTYDILCKLASMDNRIKLFKNDTNCKICKTLNRAYSHAKGTYIARMDGDDISMPTRIGSMKAFLDSDKKISLVGSNMITIDEDGKEIGRKKYLRTDKYIKKGNRYQPCVAHIWLARREMYETLNGYREVPYVEDWDFLLRGELAGYLYANVDEFLYKCRLRNGNTGTTSGLEQRKAGKFVLEKFRSEFSNTKCKLQYTDYHKIILSSEEEKKEYNKAAEYLNIAVHSRDNHIKLVYYTILAFFKSKYMAQYIISTVYIRLFFYLESRGGKC